MTLLFEAASAEMSSPFSPISVKGSFISLEGVTMGVCTVEATELDAVLAALLVEACRAEAWRPLADLPEGEASRERVFRKADLRLGGTGRVAESMGGVGILRPGKLSRSFAWSSTIS